MGRTSTPRRRVAVLSTSTLRLSRRAAKSCPAGRTYRSFAFHQSSIEIRMAGPLALNMILVGHDSWADANRFGPGYWNGWAFGPEAHSTRNGLPGITVSDGNRVFLKLPEEDGERQGNYENPPGAIPGAGASEHGGLTPNRSPAEPPPRRFHTVHDAAVWIQQNWPDFDLEATHPVIWRGEM